MGLSQTDYCWRDLSISVCGKYGSPLGMVQKGIESHKREKRKAKEIKLHKWVHYFFGEIDAAAGFIWNEETNRQEQLNL